MRKLTASLLLLVAGTLSYAQTNQQLLEAYRNGTLSASQINELKSQGAQNAQTENVQRERSINVDTVAMSSSAIQNRRDGVAVNSASVDGVAIGEGGVARRIFGHDLFRSSKLTFEPNLQIATPDNYVLGPGDEVIIDLWGNTDSSEKYKIS